MYDVLERDIPEIYFLYLQLIDLLEILTFGYAVHKAELIISFVDWILSQMSIHILKVRSPQQDCHVFVDSDSILYGSEEPGVWACLPSQTVNAPLEEEKSLCQLGGSFLFLESVIWSFKFCIFVKKGKSWLLS